MPIESHRSWFPVILLGLTLALGGLFLSRGTPPGLNFKPAATSTAPTQDEYRKAVNAVLDVYGEDHDAGAAYNALILLRVPGDSLTVHFDLVAAFGKLAMKDSADGEARLSAVKAQNAWLHL